MENNKTTLARIINATTDVTNDNRGNVVINENRCSNHLLDAIFNNFLKTDYIISNDKNAKLPGSFYVVNKNGLICKLYITKVLYNDPVTVVWWSDDTITRNKCPEGVEYSADTGLLFCIMNKIFDRNSMSDIFNAWSLGEDEETNNNYVTLKDVRNKLK